MFSRLDDVCAERLNFDIKSLLVFNTYHETVAVALKPIREDISGGLIYGTKAGTIFAVPSKNAVSANLKHSRYFH